MNGPRLTIVGFALLYLGYSGWSTTHVLAAAYALGFFHAWWAYAAPPASEIGRWIGSVFDALFD